MFSKQRFWATRKIGRSPSGASLEPQLMTTTQVFRYHWESSDYLPDYEMGDDIRGERTYLVVEDGEKTFVPESNIVGYLSSHPHAGLLDKNADESREPELITETFAPEEYVEISQERHLQWMVAINDFRASVEGWRKVYEKEFSSQLLAFQKSIDEARARVQSTGKVTAKDFLLISSQFTFDESKVTPAPTFQVPAWNKSKDEVLSDLSREA